jgi:hypothetical protein
VFGAGTTFSAGDAPAPAPGAMVFLAVQRGYLGGAIDARATLPASRATPLGMARSWSTSLGAAVCGHLWRVFACGVGHGGVVTASGVDVEGSHTASAFVASAGGRAGGSVPLSELVELRLQGEAEATLTRLHQIAIRGTPIYEYAAGSLGIALLLGLRL